MRKKFYVFTLVALFTTSSFCACTSEIKIKPDSPKDGVYSAQTANSAMEYALFLNKQTTVFTNQLTSHMMLIANTAPFYQGMAGIKPESNLYEFQEESAQQSINVMQDALDTVKVTMPSIGAEDDREAMVLAMELAIEHMTGYQEALRDGKDVSGFKNDFQNDLNALTAITNVYYQ